MQESTERDSSTKENKSRPDAAEPDSEATSKETVRDIEESEANVSSGPSEPDPGPSPDGALDESDEIKSAGPM